MCTAENTGPVSPSQAGDAFQWNARDCHPKVYRRADFPEDGPITEVGIAVRYQAIPRPRLPAERGPRPIVAKSRGERCGGAPRIDEPLAGGASDDRRARAPSSGNPRTEGQRRAVVSNASAPSTQRLAEVSVLGSRARARLQGARYEGQARDHDEPSHRRLSKNLRDGPREPRESDEPQRQQERRAAPDADLTSVRSRRMHMTWPSRTIVDRAERVEVHQRIATQFRSRWGQQMGHDQGTQLSIARPAHRAGPRDPAHERPVELAGRGVCGAARGPATRRARRARCGYGEVSTRSPTRPRPRAVDGGWYGAAGAAPVDAVPVGETQQAKRMPRDVPAAKCRRGDLSAGPSKYPRRRSDRGQLVLEQRAELAPQPMRPSDLRSPAWVPGMSAGQARSERTPEQCLCSQRDFTWAAAGTPFSTNSWSHNGTRISRSAPSRAGPTVRDIVREIRAIVRSTMPRRAVARRSVAVQATE